MKIRVTSTDIETGDEETVEIEDNFVLVCAGNRYLAHENIYGNGTTQLTIKTREPEARPSRGGNE